MWTQLNAAVEKGGISQNMLKPLQLQLATIWQFIVYQEPARGVFWRFLNIRNHKKTPQPEGAGRFVHPFEAKPALEEVV